jgi:hypothetical protein
VADPSEVELLLAAGGRTEVEDGPVALDEHHAGARLDLVGAE